MSPHIGKKSQRIQLACPPPPMKGQWLVMTNLIRIKNTCKVYSKNFGPVTFTFYLRYIYTIKKYQTRRKYLVSIRSNDTEIAVCLYILFVMALNTRVDNTKRCEIQYQLLTTWSKIKRTQTVHFKIPLTPAK